MAFRKGRRTEGAMSHHAGSVYSSVDRQARLRFKVLVDLRVLRVELCTPKRSTEILTPSTCKCDLLYRENLLRGERVRPGNEWTLIQCDVWT